MQTISVDTLYQTHKRAQDTGDVVLRLPRASLWNVLEVAFEYDLGSLPKLQQPRILDIGANTGIFAIACAQQWPGARIMSFEPHPETAKLLRNNVQGLPVEVHEKAVIGWQRSNTSDLVLHEGKRNRLCCSLFDVGDQDMSTAIPVQSALAAELPECDVLKVDTEGAEGEILEAYRHLGSVKVLLAELHGATPEAVMAAGQQVAAFAHKANLRQIDQRANTLRFARHA